MCQLFTALRRNYRRDDKDGRVWYGVGTTDTYLTELPIDRSVPRRATCQSTTRRCITPPVRFQTPTPALREEAREVPPRL